MNRSKHTSHLHRRFLDQTFKQELGRMAKDAYREALHYIANLQSIFDFLEEELQISQDHDMLDGSDWEYRTANSLHVTDDQFERFHEKVKQKLDRHLNEYEGKFTAQLYNTQSDLCMRTPHMDRTGLLSTIVFSVERVLS